MKRWGKAILILSLIVVWGGGLLPKHAEWRNLQYRLSFCDGRFAFGKQFDDAYGEVGVGPSLDLPEGEYVLTLQTDADAENEVVFSTENDAKIEPERIVIEPDGGTQTVKIALRQAAKALQMHLMYTGGTYLDVYSIHLQSPAYADNRFTLTFFVLLLAAMYGLYEAEKKRIAPADELPMARMRVALLLLAAAAFASIPTMKDSLTYGLDTTFHMARIRNLADALKAGQFPARVGGFSYNGYGAVTSVFYPDFLLTPLALMLLAGASVPYVMHAFTVAVNLLTAYTAYVCARRVLGERMKAACASVLYVLSADRLMSLYTRAAMGEMLAMSFFPIFFLGLWETLRGEKARWPTLALGATAVFQCHMISTLLCAGMAAGMGLLYLPRVIREKRVGAILKAMAATLLLNLFVLVPMTTFVRQGVSAANTLTDSSYWLIQPAQLFLDAVESDGGQVVAGMNADAIVLGLPLLLGGFLAVYRAATGENMRRALGFGTAGLLLAFACTTASPWRSVNEMLHGLLNYVQMPFRILTMASFFLALCSGDALCTAQTEKKKEARLWAALALCAVCVHPLLSDHALSTRILPYGREDFSSINLDYRLPNMDESTLEDTQIAVSDGAEITDFQKDGTHIVANIATEQAASLTVPLFAFDGYEAKLDGQALDWTQDDRARLTVRLPENARGRLEIRYVGKAIWRVGDAVSAATLIGLLFWMKKGEKKACRTH